MYQYKTILVEEKDGIGYFTLNRPDVHNAFNQEMLDEARDALRKIDRDFDIRVLIITGAGKSFQAGADLDDLNKMTPLELLRWNEGAVRMFSALEKIRQPVIAAINGPAFGGGTELAISCSLRIIAENARMSLSEVKLGLIPGAGGTQRLPRLIGKGRATEMLLTAEIIDAQEAYRIGLVNKVVPKGEAVKGAEEMAHKILANAPVAVEMAKDALEIGKDIPLEQAIQYSQKNCVTCFTTEDLKEGTSAFLEKRKANFQGK